MSSIVLSVESDGVVIAASLGVDVKRLGQGLAERAALELRAEAAEAHALARYMARRRSSRQAVIDLERYASALEAKPH